MCFISTCLESTQRRCGQGADQLALAQSFADRLNNAGQSEDVVPSDAVFAAAGLCKDGIVEHIRESMSRKFPNVPLPELAGSTGSGAVAYAYLAASSKYEYPFFENDEPFIFTDSAGVLDLLLVRSGFARMTAMRTISCGIKCRFFTVRCVGVPDAAGNR